MDSDPVPFLTRDMLVNTLNLMKLTPVRVSTLLDRHGLPRRVGTRSEGQRVRPDMLEAVGAAPRLVVVDLHGVELLNSSFADEIVALPLQRVCSGEFGDRYLVVVTPSLEVIQDVQLPLEKRNLTLMVFEGELAANRWSLLGISKSYFVETLTAIMRLGNASTGDLAKVLDISLQNCSNRLTELSSRRLIQREREFGVRGGQTHTNRSILELAG
jgi:hypothetical protein